MNKWIIGIDEAGRGPLAGPVSVGVVCVKKGFNWNVIEGVDDSKKLTMENREAIFRRTRTLKKEGKLDFSVSMVSSKIVDKIGIVPSVSLAINRALKKIEQNHPSPRSDLGISSFYRECVVKLDGGLKAPLKYTDQETIIKGDSKEKIIGLASIMAKVTRDRYMVQISVKPKFAPYNLATHKGYGTKKHIEAIKKYGLSEIHRKTYCKNLIV